MQISQNVLEIFEHILEKFQSLSQHEGIEPELIAAILAYAGSRTPENLSQLCLILNTIDIRKHHFLNLFLISPFFHCCQWIRQYIPIELEHIEKLLCNEHLYELQEFMEDFSKYAPIQTSNAKIIIDILQSDPKISAKSEMLEFCAHHDLLNQDHIIHILKLRYPVVFFQTLLLFKEIHILTPSNFLHILEFTHIDLLKDFLNKIKSIVTPEKAQEVIEKLFLHPEIERILNILKNFEFERPFKIQELIEYLQTTKLHHFEKVMHSGYFYICTHIEFAHFLHIVKLPDALFPVLFSAKFAEKIQDKEYCHLLFKTTLSEFKWQQIISCLSIFERKEIFVNQDFYTPLTQFIIDYKKSFSLNAIFYELAQIEMRSYQDFINSFAFFENQQAIKENILQFQVEELPIIPLKFQENFSQIRSNPSNIKALLNLSLDILQSSVETLPRNFQRLMQTHYMECLIQIESSPYLGEQTLAILLQEKIEYTFAKHICIFNEFGQREELESITDFQQKYNLLHAPFFNELIALISRFQATHGIIRLCIRLYLMDVLKLENHIEIFDILEKLKNKSNFIELKKAFFRFYHQKNPDFTAIHYLILMNENIEYLISFKNNELPIPIERLQTLAQYLSKNSQLELILDLMMRVPEYILMNDTELNIPFRILNHPQLDEICQIFEHLNTPLIENPKYYQGILEHPYPSVLNEVIRAQGFSQFQALHFETRLQYLYHIGTYSTRARDFLSRFSIREPHHLYEFLMGLMPYLNDDAYIRQFDFLHWIAFCDKNTLIHFQNIIEVLSVASPKQSLASLQKLIKTQSFKMNPHFYFKHFINAHDPRTIVDLIICFENKGIEIPADLFQLITQTKSIHEVIKIIQILFLKQHFKPSYNYPELLKKMIIYKDIMRIYLILKNFKRLKYHDYLAELIECITETKYIVDIFELLHLNFCRLAIKDEAFYQNIFTMIHSPFLPKIVKILKIAQQNHLFTLSEQMNNLKWIKGLIYHKKIEQLLNIIPVVLKINSRPQESIQNLQTLMSNRLDNLEQFILDYKTLNQAIYDALNSHFYNYHDSKLRLEKLIAGRYIDPEDKASKIQFLSIAHLLFIEKIVQDFERLLILKPENQKFIIKKILFHPKYEEIHTIETTLSSSKIDITSPRFSRLFELILKSPSPFNSSYLVGQLFDTRILYFFSLEYLEHLFSRKQSYDLACFLSIQTLLFKSLIPEDAANLFIVCVNLKSSHHVFELFQYLIANLGTEPPALIIQLMLKLKSSNHLLETLEKLKHHHMLNLENITRLFNHPRIDSIGEIINIYEQKLHFNHDIFIHILENEHPNATALLLNYAQSFGICNQDFLREILTLNTILFHSPAVVSKFMRIPQTFILELNLKQFINIAKIFRDDPTQASEELLRFCNQLALHSSNAQITHLKSVHESSSETAKRLAKRYASTPINVYELFSSLKSEILKLEDERIETEVAARCIQNFIKHQYKDKIDQSSQISLQQLLAYCILAIYDESVALGEFTDRVKALRKGLNDIQRGYNEEIGQEQDLSICDGGAFNKLNEVLVGIHPDFEQRVVNLNSASFKFQRLAIHHAKKFLTELETPKDKIELASFTSMIHELQTNGLSVIWKMIQDPVAKELFEEFSEIFSSQQDPSFTSLVSYGTEVEITELNSFFEELVETKRQQYHLYRQSFFANYKKTNPFIQHEFDKEYGLIFLDTHWKR